MTKATVERICRKLSIGHGGYRAWNIRFEPFKAVMNGDTVMHWAVAIKADLPERNSGEVRHRPSFVAFLDVSDEELRFDDFDSLIVYRVRSILQQLARHEMDESILVDGLRVFDPHATPATTTAEAHP